MAIRGTTVRSRIIATSILRRTTMVEDSTTRATLIRSRIIATSIIRAGTRGIRSHSRKRHLISVRRHNRGQRPRFNHTPRLSFGRCHNSDRFLRSSRGLRRNRTRIPRLSNMARGRTTVIIRITSTESEFFFLASKAHGQPWALLRQASAGCMPAISTSSPPNSGWSFSRTR